MQLRKSVLRYAVTFRYNGTLEEIAKSFPDEGVRVGQWRRVVSMETSSGQSDLYDHVRDEFLFSENSLEVPRQKMGLTWEGKYKAGTKSFGDYTLCLAEELCGDAVDFSIVRVGVSIYRDGIGIFWYEIKLDDETISYDRLMTFQNIIKNINRPRLLRRLYEKGTTTLTSIAEWIAVELKSLLPTFIQERLSAVGKVRDLVPEETLPRVPSRTVLFTYAVFDEDETVEKDAFVYRLTNGYTQRFLVNTNIKEKILHPFDNTSWYATQEGVSYIAWSKNKDDRFFMEELPVRIRGDYFTLFMKCFFLSQSLMRFSERVQEELSASVSDFMSPENSSIAKELNCLTNSINVFLTKSMATSVSHVHHQSEFFVYLKEEFRVIEDVKSLSSGLRNLELFERDLQTKHAWAEETLRDKKEKKHIGQLQAVMGVLAILGLSSALVDWYDLLSNFIPNAKIVSVMSWFSSHGGDGWIWFPWFFFTGIALVGFGYSCLLYFKYRNEKNDD